MHPILRAPAAMLAFASLALATPATPASAAPSREEARMAAFVREDVAYNDALLERLVNQNSGTLNIEGVTRVGEMMRRELEDLGFAVRWVDMRATGRAGHIVAVHRSTGPNAGRGKRILLIGHLDTVFEPSSPFQRFTRDGARAIGPGVSDDKGGMVIIIGALRAMRAAGTLAGADIEVVLTGDEERSGDPLSVARADLIAAGQRADVALEYEELVRDSAADGGGDYGTVARRSSSSWALTTTGTTGHSGGIFSAGSGYGAAYELVRILDRFRAELREENATFNIGVMAAGTPAGLDATDEVASATGKTNIIAAQGVARGDLRTLTREQDARIRTAMQAIVADHLPGTSATLTFDDGYPPMAPTPGNRALLDALNRVNRDLGLPIMRELPPARRGAADSSFVAADVDTLAGLGAAGLGAHAEGESVDLASLPLQALRSAALISRLTREARPAGN